MHTGPQSGQKPSVPSAAESKSSLGSAGARRMIIRSFPWHAKAFLGANLLLCLVNYLSGPPWWAVWPLMITAILLGLHYLFYKAVTVDDRWAEERVEELNLKSYDRSHIEDLKARYDMDGPPRKT